MLQNASCLFRLPLERHRADAGAVAKVFRRKPKTEDYSAALAITSLVWPPQEWACLIERPSLAFRMIYCMEVESNVPTKED
jgi:hypothetical protein